MKKFDNYAALHRHIYEQAEQGASIDECLHSFLIDPYKPTDPTVEGACGVDLIQTNELACALRDIAQDTGSID